MAEKYDRQAWITLIFCNLAALCLGTVYIWGVYQPFVMEHFSYTSHQASQTFSVTLAALVAGSILGGKLQEKAEPQKVIGLGGVLYAVGAFLAGLQLSMRPLYLYATFGALCGLGMGMIYTSILTCSQRWFRNRRGFVMGLIAGSMGLGGVVFVPVSQFFLQNFGVRQNFFFYAVLFLFVFAVCAAFVKNPPVPAQENAGRQNDLLPRDMLRHKSFYLLCGAFFLAAPAYLLVTPHLNALGAERGLGAENLAAAVMTASLFNVAGRLITTFLSKKTGRENMVIALTLITALATALLLFAKGWGFVLAASVISFCYGGYHGIFPVLTSGHFGVKNAGENYGYVLIGFGLSASLTPLLFGPSQTGYGPALALAAGFSVLAAVFLFLLKRNGKN